jgi:hypothetical protein
VLEHSNKNSWIARISFSRLVKFENYQAESSSEILHFPADYLRDISIEYVIARLQIK